MALIRGKYEDSDWMFTESGFREFSPIRGTLRPSVPPEIVMQNYVRVFSQYYFAGSEKRFDFRTGVGRTTFDDFRDLLRFCHDREIDAHLFISPCHAVQWETIDAIGLWSTFEAWKRKLVELNETVASERGRAPFPFIDFSGYNVVTTEVIPSVSDNDHSLEYYYDPSHYRPRTGSLILSRLVTGNPADGFGRDIHGETTDLVLSEIRRERSEWRAEYPDEYSKWRNIATAAMPGEATVAKVP